MQCSIFIFMHKYVFLTTYNIMFNQLYIQQ